MRNNSIMYTAIGTVLGAGIGMALSKTMCKKATTLKRTAGKALHAAGSFIEHMSF